MKLREVKLLAAGIVVASLVTTNVIVPSILQDIPVVRVTAISKLEPLKEAAVPEPVRVLTTAESNARAAAMRAHADHQLAEAGELPGHSDAGGANTADATLKCVAGCN